MKGRCISDRKVAFQDYYDLNCKYNTEKSEIIISPGECVPFPYTIPGSGERWMIADI